MREIEIRPLIFGEVLFDHFPDGSVVLGGAPFNVAWHLHAFGLKPLMVSRIGNDELGDEIERAMQGWGMDCNGLQHDNEHVTGTVQVTINSGEPSYEIVDWVAYDFIDASQLPPLHGHWLLYHGSLALRHEHSANALRQIREQHADGLMVDINLRPPWWQRDTVLSMLEGADRIKLNQDELADIYPEIESQLERVDLLREHVSEQIFLTGGEQGATAISTRDGARISVVPEQLSAITDTVGAGDAFCSVLLAGQLLGWPLELTMRRAQAFASGIVGIRGATSRERSFYQQFTRAWGLKD